MFETMLTILDKWALLIAVLLPLVAVIKIATLRERFRNLREAAILTISTLTFGVVLYIYQTYSLGDASVSLTLFEIMPSLTIALHAEALGLIFALVASSLWIVATIYSIGYMRGNNEVNQSRFYACFAVAITASLGIAFSANLLTLFLFYELMTICTYPLVAHHQTLIAKRGARTYLGLLMGLSILLLLPAIIGIWYLTGTLDFTSGGILKGDTSAGIIALLLFLVMYGVGKAALMPAHRWLPAAMVAPTPVSALLHAVAVVKAGVFCLIKIVVYIFGIDTLATISQNGLFYGQWVMYAAGFTVIAASCVALAQDNLKKRLAYSTISQLSYVILALSLFSPLGVIAAGFHIAAHAFGKITLFFAAGSIYTASKKKNVSELDGIGKQMPWTMTAFAIGSLSMIGIPPAAGFITKWYMLDGAFAGNQLFVVGVIILSTLLNAMYFLPILARAFFAEDKSTASLKNKQHGEANPAIVIALTITAAGTLLLGLQPDIILSLAEKIGVN